MAAGENLMLVGGIYHPFEAAAERLAQLLQEFRVPTVTVTHPDEWLQRLAAEPWRMSTVYALRWRMLNDEKYQPFMSEWAYAANPAQFRIIEDFVDAGGALLGMHTAPICFDTWENWGGLLGARWVWGTSWHPPLGRAQIVANDNAMEIDDEVYHSLEIAPDAEVLATGLGEDRAQHPIVLRRRQGQGRVLCDALGHDAASIDHDGHRALLAQGIEWLLEAH